MAKKNSSPATQKRKTRLLWANPFCLLDTSSGANMSVRQMLHQLVARGYDVQVLGATVFDNPKGMGGLKEQVPNLGDHLHQLVEVEDGPLTHQLLVTQRPSRRHLTAHEEGLWHSQYTHMLDSFKPDVVWFYGGQTLDLLIPDEARVRGIPSAFYLVNGNYKAARWCRDIDLIITDTRATSEMYREKIGFVPTPVGKFIDPEGFVAKHNSRERLLFVNPSWPKGASVFVQLAEKLERERPDIPLEVVEARADWSAVLRDTTRKLGKERERLANVTVTPNTSDMRDPYSRARILMAPSLWWESGARVLAEAMLNGIPAIVSDSGGNADMIGDGGMVVELPEPCFEKPYQHLLSDSELQPLFDAVVALFDDETLYQDYVARATRVGEEQHHISVSIERLVTAFAPLVSQRAGSKDFLKAQRRSHKHKVVGTAGKPEFKAAPIPTPQVPARHSEPMALRSGKPLSGSFDWQFKGKVIVLDNRAKLIQAGSLEKLLATKAFGVVAFDPASEVQDVKQYEGGDSVQVFQHALLGDGKPGTLYTCLASEMSSTLEPLPAEQLPQQRCQDARVLTKLPINTIALDSIEGLESLDWLILDELSDAVTILEHGKQALKDTLLIQARVAFQPTHARQPSLAELQHWASRNGFRFYRFNDASYQSLFPQDSLAHQQLASELQSLDALFLPTPERLSQMDDNRKQKLVFLLHTVFDAQDMAYQVMGQVNELLAKNYLRFVEGEEQSLNNKALQSKTATEEGVVNAFTKRAALPENLKPGEKGIFIDCGGYDGCSAIKFKINNPGFECVTFEPNPALWSYYDKLPTKLFKKAAYTYNGNVKFTLDSLDEDGSSLIERKRIDYTGRVDNEKFPSIEAECIDISEFIEKCKNKYNKIILKMDIEGAEYDILDSLINKDLLKSIDKLYCEFHWHKCGIPESRHNGVVEIVEQYMPVLDWDALDFSVHKRGESRERMREVLLSHYFNTTTEKSGGFVFHVGMHRTGTTTLQEKFFPQLSNYIGRCKQKYGGWGYDELSKELLTTSKKNNPYALDEFIKGSEKLRESLQESALIFSNEALVEPVGWGVAPFTNNGGLPKDKAVTPVFDFLSELKSQSNSDVKVIFIVRRQPEWLASFYSRVSGSISGAGQDDFDVQIKNVLSENIDWIDWSLWVKKFQDILGNENFLCLPMEMMAEDLFWREISKFISCNGVENLDFYGDAKENKYSVGNGRYRIVSPQSNPESGVDDCFLLDENNINLILRNERVSRSNVELESLIGVNLKKYSYY